MKRWMAVAVMLLALVGCFGILDERRESIEYQDPGPHPTENMTYGNCSVVTHIDALTDKEAHGLSCANFETPTTASVRLLWDGEPIVNFEIESLFYSEPLIPVAFRIDKREVIRELWLWPGEGYALTLDRSVFDTLLDELPTAKRIVIEIGNEQAIIPLRGSATAVKDFRSRIGQPAKWPSSSDGTESRVNPY